MNLEQLRKKRDELLTLSKAALTKSAAAIGEDKFEDAEAFTKEAEGYKAQIKQLTATIENMEELQATEKSLESPQRLPFDDGGEETTKSANAENADDGAVKAFDASAVNVLRYGEIPNAVKQVTQELYPKYYKDRALQRGAITKYIRFGKSRLDVEETKSLRNIILTPDMITKEVMLGYGVNDIAKAVKVQQEGALELGGVLVPEDFRLDIVRRLMGMTVVRGLARQVSTLRDAVEWPKMDSGDSRRTSQVRVTWIDEVPSDENVAQSPDMEFGSIRIPVHTVMARLDLSLNLLEDAGVDVIGLVAELFAEEMALDEDEKFLIGTGAGTPQGILGKRDGSTYVPVDGISVVNSGNAAALDPDGLIDLVYDLDAQYLKEDNVVIGSKRSFRDIRKMKDGNGDYLWARGLEKGAPPTVLDYDYRMNEVLQNPAANNYPLIFGNLRRAYMIADRIGMTIKRVEDTTTTGKNKAALFARRRLGGQVIQPWALAVQKVSE
jgi:HK97 family phage major capsid protein